MILELLNNRNHKYAHADAKNPVIPPAILKCSDLVIDTP